MIEWDKPEDTHMLASGQEGDYHVTLCLETFFWYVVNNRSGELVANGTGAGLAAARHVIQMTVSSLIGKDKMRTGSYPPGVPNSGGKK